MTIRYPIPHSESNPPTEITAKDEAADRVSNQIDRLFEQTKRAAEIRDSVWLESVLRELTLLNDIKTYLENPEDAREPLRAIVDFLDGDTNRPPCVFPMAGSLEADNKVRREIERRWSKR
jgi:hypothetical protein